MELVFYPSQPILAPITDFGGETVCWPGQDPKQTLILVLGAEGAFSSRTALPHTLQMHPREEFSLLMKQFPAVIPFEINHR